MVVKINGKELELPEKYADKVVEIDYSEEYQKSVNFMNFSEILIKNNVFYCEKCQNHSIFTEKCQFCVKNVKKSKKK
jgi:hypothetical protein